MYPCSSLGLPKPPGPLFGLSSPPPPPLLLLLRLASIVFTSSSSSPSSPSPPAAPHLVHDLCPSPLPSCRCPLALLPTASPLLFVLDIALVVAPSLSPPLPATPSPYPVHPPFDTRARIALAAPDLHDVFQNAGVPPLIAMAATSFTAPPAPASYLEHGRAYHGFRKGIYMYPCDDVRPSSTSSPLTMPLTLVVD